ncbi:DNA-binding protein [Listeria monocytogenes]|uniref:DNA-binding protein n=3 Tax=Listeria TaxID=1637 RepID=A0A099W7V2_9LIST|nr:MULTISPECIES: phage-related protein [Listeria]EFR85004.1 phage-related protein [Listeria monocytogenes FSL F2-208]EFS03588.1 phage-related protein [Listeria seeligeri FSL S4-171]EHC6164234.1 DNA-binding protein [Listeria monocytogenes serotype 1/2b]EAA0128571.1 DNA-binding protein [Listeria monocytogenes]EAC2331564.1 DNA-binding protein [Listeria monocytogenes]
MTNDLFISAGEVAKITGMSKPYAYKLIQKLNKELEKKGYCTIRGKVSKKYLEEQFYGM